VSRFGAALAIGALLAAAAPAGASGGLLDLPVRHGRDPAAPLADVLHGAPAVVTFWASYCPPCRAEVPVLQRAARRWGPRGVRVLGIAVDLDDPERVERTARQWGIEYETYWVPADAHERIARLAPEGLPVTFFVGSDGVARHDQLVSDADLDRLVPQHLHVEALR